MTMKSSPLLLAISLVSVGAWAQPARGPEAAAQIVPEQRRAALRQALKAAPARDGQAREPALKGAPEKRHLSPQERADLRQQLRQQRPDARSERP